MSQVTNNIMMIEPVLFNYNSETAINNYYQNNIQEMSNAQIQEKALKEFNDFVNLLRSKFINVYVFKDSNNPKTPDSVFPNNWISFHGNGDVYLYPMFAKNRRLERREEIINKLKDDFIISKVNSLVHYENEGLFLEGTGSMILDRENNICYAARSVRTDKSVLLDFCKQSDYKPVLFSAFQDANSKRLPIYHTNVMMCVAKDFAVVCLDSIDSQIERVNVITSLEESNKEIIEISEFQANKFAGNMLQVKGDKLYLIMSESAFKILSDFQINKIRNYSEILSIDLEIIEKCGGGSARCMMAEIFLPLKK
jgi:hypothetical protein